MFKKVCSYFYFKTLKKKMITKFPWDEGDVGYCFVKCDISYLLIKQSNGALPVC